MHNYHKIDPDCCGVCKYQIVNFPYDDLYCTNTLRAGQFIEFLGVCDLFEREEE